VYWFIARYLLLRTRVNRRRGLWSSRLNGFLSGHKRKAGRPTRYHSSVPADHRPRPKLVTTDLIVRSLRMPGSVPAWFSSYDGARTKYVETLRSQTEITQ